MSITDILDDSIKSRVKINGVVTGIVTNNQDPDGLGRVKVKIPRLNESDESNWARVAAFMSGNEKGAFFLPEIDDEVLIAFEFGNIEMPYVIGSLWNGKNKPPETNDDGKNNIKIIKSRSGHIIKLDDTDGSEKIEIIDKSESNKITIDTANNKISIISGQDIELSASSGKIILDSKELEIKTSENVKIEASQDIKINASKNLTLKGATVNIN